MSTPSTIAHYKLATKLGEGGMGAVYRGTDTKLNRDVAIKVLPPAFAEDAARMQRFEREAQVLASLNHPNIAAIYGIEQGAIIMELVEGADLAGPLPVDTVIAYSRQIVAGLEAAHEKGIIHRDLKPANIKVTPEGIVKLLDFGLAKATEQSAAASAAPSPTMSPTLSLAMTQAGMILGTAAYMSPEQARGKPVDKRADIWAFGVVLYEMLTGRHLFGGGETVTDILASVVKDAPDLKALPPDTPANLRRLLDRCLRKDTATRLRDIGEARVLLSEPEQITPPPAAPPPTKRSLAPWIAFACALAAGTAGWTVAWLRPKPADPVAVRFPLPMPEGLTTWGGPTGANAVASPDGRYLAFLAATPDGNSSLWIRPMNSPVPRRLDKTEGANFPFWSPDGQFLAFFANEKLKKIPVAGGAPITICDIPKGDSSRQSTGDGGAWNPGGVIVFGVGLGMPLMRVPSAGGTPAPVTSLDKPARETRHAWPQFLPDDRHLLYYAGNADPDKSGIYVQEMGSTQRVLVMRSLYRGAWAPPGYLLFPRDSALFAQRLDPRSFQLTGEPVRIAEDVNSNAATGRSAFSVSAGGVLVHRGGSAVREGPLAWYDRSGKRLSEVAKPAEIRGLRLSPDDKTVALNIGPGGHSDIYVLELASGVLSRMTNTGRSTPNSPWSPDSKFLLVNMELPTQMMELTVASGKIRQIGDAPINAADWSPDGKFLLCLDTAGRRLTALDLQGDQKPRLINESTYPRSNFRLSPDGKFVAYTSSESQPGQLVVASYPSFEQRRQISKEGGTYPTWRRDGQEIFFRSSDGMLMSADIKLGTKIEASVPKPLFRYGAGPLGQTYWPSGDGKRFLVKESDRSDAATPIMVVVNWVSELKQP